VPLRAPRRAAAGSLPTLAGVRCTGRPAVSLAGSAVVIAMVIAMAAVLLGACRSGGDGETVEQGPGTSAAGPSTSVATPTSAVATSASQPPPTVARPGPPATGQCGVVLDDPARGAGGTVTVRVLSGIPGATFLARVVAGSTTSTEAGTVDGSGSGTIRLQLPASTPGEPTQVEVSVAGGAETCSATFTPR
jgi:hypothetical protein